jgi:glutamyl-tRNA synthetase
MRTLTDFTEHITAFYSDKIHFDEKGVEKYLKKEGTRKLLKAWRDRLLALRSFDKGALEEKCRTLAEELGVKPARLIHPTRVAISGRTTGAGLFETMEVMGKDTVIRRLDYAINKLAQ